MNKQIISLLAFLTISFSVFSQDIIKKTDGSLLKCKIVEVGEESTKYKKEGMEDGPDFTISNDKISTITFKNGHVEKFSDAESSAKEEPKYTANDGKKLDLEDEDLKKTIEGIARSAGEQVLRECSGGGDNNQTEIYWDGVYKDALNGELHVPIRISWQRGSGSFKWIKGAIKVSKEGRKHWVYQNDSGILFSNCAKKVREIR
jgi:hypothetical protein